jgi:hypothetical protein
VERIFSGYLILFGISQTVLLLAFLPPRPSLRRLMRQPGFVAGLAVAFSLLNPAMTLVGRLVLGLLPAPAMRLGSFETWIRSTLAMISYPTELGPLVGLAWLVQWLAGIRRPEPAWIDHVGRFVGWSWIVLYVSHHVLLPYLVMW